MVKSSTQKFVTLLVTKAKLYAATSCAQDMLFVWRLMTAMGLKVKLPMILQFNNKGMIDLSKTGVQVVGHIIWTYGLTHVYITISEQVENNSDGMD